MTTHGSIKRLTAGFLASLTLGCLGQAQSVVMPPEAQHGPGEQIGQNLFFGNASLGWPGLRVQTLYDTSHIPHSTLTINSISIRRATGPLTNNPVTVQAVIRMSTTATPHDMASPTFAANHGPNLTTVFQGTINMPHRAPNTQWPAPWEAPIVLQTPFTFVNSPGSLVVDIATTGNNSSGTWAVERYKVSNGGSNTDLVQTGCLSSTGAAVNGRVYQSLLIPGGYFQVGYWFYPSNEPLLNASLIAIGFAGTNVPGFPIPLSSFGLPSSAGCEWGVDVAFTLGATYFPGPSTHPTLGMVGMASSMPIPNSPLLVDQDFYSQALSFDAGPGGAPQLLASVSERLHIGSGLAPDVTTVAKIDHLSPTGGVTPNDGMAIRFN